MGALPPDGSGGPARHEAGLPQERHGVEPLPERIHLDELHELSTAQLVKRMQDFRIRAHPDRTRHQLVADTMRHLAERGVEVLVEGVLEMASENHGFLRWPRYSFRPGPEDVYVPSGVIRRYGLQSGNLVAGRLRPARDREKFLALEEVRSIEGMPAEAWSVPKPFDSLTATFPNERIILENAFCHVSASGVPAIESRPARRCS